MFPTKRPSISSGTSKTYRPLQCHHNPNLCGSHKCDDQFCTYDISYVDDSYSKGVIAYDKFTFNGFPRGQETKAFVLDQEKVSFAEVYPENQIARILGLGWAPDTPHIQLNSETDSKFSYCLQFEHTPPYETYLRFGFDIKMTPIFKKHSSMNIMPLRLVSVSINRQRLPSHQKNRMILGSGACSSYPIKPIYEDLEKWLIRKTKEEFCYERKKPVPPGHEYDRLPTITLNFEGADFVIKPDGVFSAQVDVLQKQFFRPTTYPDEEDNLLGTYQQADHRMVFDLKKLLHFQSENC
ncbi:LOW QUALITY PROTEIN: hypothetical protein Cgig2_022525 [Carnegiea gigantea]|uniref:Peptidase A1 domain-containing protein n=1 Tax=Carnegiea gigantea TaxID=171969 RepID=A0A9Q1GKH6_9CARY|nr:LOW QUALITY PROTEIN: hypothetical protein Cgig2_022525 [Carnegiea gigantea]